MPSLRLFDVQLAYGGATPGQTAVVTKDEVKAELERLDIARALVRFGPDNLVFDVPRANDRLYADCAGDDMLVPCPIVLPNTAHDLPSEEAQVGDALAHGAGAVVLRPGPDGWCTEAWACGDLFRVLEAHRVPVVCLERLLPPVTIADLATRHPGLPLILAEANYRALRVYLPLLEQHPNVHLSLGNNFHVHAGLEHLVRHVGPERLLFGTGFPAAEALCAITQLVYAAIPEAAREAIAHGNLERLIEEVRP